MSLTMFGDDGTPSRIIKSIPSMTKAELVKEVERLATLVRSQSAAMTELGKLSDMQQARIADLNKALLDADHLCRWLLQSDIGEADRERVIRDNGIAFALIVASSEPRL